VLPVSRGYRYVPPEEQQHDEQHQHRPGDIPRLPPAPPSSAPRRSSV
jgi:hypothetical protein